VTNLTRRQAIRGAATLVGGALAAGQLTPFLSRVARAADESAEPVFFDESQFELLGRIADVMIPETDTPGATGAGVDYFIDLMLDEWASPERQVRFRLGIDALGNALQEDGTAFVDAPADVQLARLRSLDAQAFEPAAGNSFYQEFKRMVLFAYYSSEAGATLELQYEALIPEYKACEPLKDIGRAWFWVGFSHGL
jgi:hypothetical protein